MLCLTHPQKILSSYWQKCALFNLTLAPSPQGNALHLVGGWHWQKLPVHGAGSMSELWLSLRLEVIFAIQCELFIK